MGQDLLELFSFKVDENIVEKDNVFFLHFPKCWRDLIEQDKNNFKLKVKPINLGKKLQAVFPTIFNVSWNNDEPWILTDKKVDFHIIKLICLQWFAKENKCAIRDLPMEVQDIELVWQTANIGELIRLYKQQRWKYNWFPGFMARKFASKPRHLIIENGYNGDLTFHHVYFNGNHECMSEPIRKNEKSGYFSYVIRFSLKTRGGTPEPSILNVSFGIRRFLQKGLKNTIDIHHKRKGSVLISLPNPFIQSEDSPSSYAQLKFRKIKNGQIVWADGADHLFADLLEVPFLPGDILKNPLQFINNEQFSTIVVYSDLVFTSRSNLSKVLSGIGLPEKWALFDLVRSTFHELKPLEPIPIISKHQYSMSSDVLPLHHSYPENTKLKLEIWGSEELYNEVIAILADKKILLKKEKNTYHLNTKPTIDIEIVSRNTTKLTEALDMNHGDKAYEHRVKFVKKLAGTENNESEIIMSLVEIENKETYESGTDPKVANRTGLALANRISQFIYPIEIEEEVKKKESRIVNSFYDLLSDHGFFPVRAERIEQDVIFLGMSLINGKVKGKGRSEGYLPVVTRMYQNEVKVRLFGRNDWLNLREALLEAGRLTKSSLLEKPSKNEESVNRYKSFFKRAVEHCLHDYESNIVILLDAKMRNEKWTELTNPKLNKNMLPLILEHPQACNRVRFVRVNTTDDIQQYRINQKGKVDVNRNQGLFKDTSGAYYSVGARPDNMQTDKRMQKFNRPMKQILHQRLVELIPLGTELPVERDQLAIWSHKLRKINNAYEFHTILPYPLDIIKSIKKYITVLQQDDFEDNDPDVFEDWIYEDDKAQMTFLFSESL